MKVLIVFALISVLASNGWAQDLSCKELETMAENGLRKMFLQEEGASLPTNEAEVESRCNEGKKLYKALLEYKKCLGPFPQQVFGATTTSIGKLLKKNCGDAEGKKMALKLFQCATPEKVKESQKCVAGSLDSIEKISQSAEGKKTIVGQMCCLAHVATDCAREKIGGITCPDPSVKPMEFFDEAINSLSKETMELACEDFKTMDQCNAKIPESVAMLKKSMVDADSSLKDRHLIKPLLKIADKVAN